MNIIIFGAAGGCGIELVARALEQEHKVTAFMRNKKNFQLNSRNLRIIEGDVKDQLKVNEALIDQEVVISALGTSNNATVICGDGIKSILSAMRESNCHRIVAISTHGAGDSRDNSFYSRLTWLTLKPRMLDKNRMEALLKQSSVDWTIVRATRLVNESLTLKYYSNKKLKAPLLAKISRSQIADFIINIVSTKYHIKEAVSLAS